ncbi:NmrA/HSCARG family protein [Amycolatopsis sp. NPDC003676]
MTTVLVTGATGAQGGATARGLLAAGQRVRALVRDPDASAAQALEAAGAELVRGDLGDRASLDVAVKGADGVFSVQPTLGYPGTPPDFTLDDELRYGRNIADAAAAAGVRTFVYASVASADAPHGITRWQTKSALERYARDLGLPVTALRPVRFMENQIHPQLGVRDGVLTDVFLPETPVQLIAAADIGAFATLAFTRPAEYAGRTIELAGDELTMPRIAQAIARATGEPVAYRPIPREALTGRDPDAVAGYDFANNGGWHADISALRKEHPALLDFAAWLG